MTGNCHISRKGSTFIEPFYVVSIYLSVYSVFSGLGMTSKFLILDHSVYGSQVSHLLDGITKMLLTRAGRYSGSTWRLMTLPQYFRISSPIFTFLLNRCTYQRVQESQITVEFTLSVTPKTQITNLLAYIITTTGCGQCSRLYLTMEKIAPQLHDELNFLTEKAKREVSARFKKPGSSKIRHPSSP